MLESFTNISAKSTIFETYQTSLPCSAKNKVNCVARHTDRKRESTVHHNNFNYEIATFFQIKNINQSSLNVFYSSGLTKLDPGLHAVPS